MAKKAKMGHGLRVRLFRRSGRTGTAMKIRGVFALLSVFISSLVLVLQPASAQQGGPFLALVNGSGQLVIGSADGSFRWIVTNPGEPLHPALGFSWSPWGSRLFFAVGGGETSLRVADVGSQSVSEIGRVSGAVTGGYWTPDGNGILIAPANRLLVYPASGGEPLELASASETIVLRSPFDAASERPNLLQGRNMSSGQFLFYAQGNSNVVQALGGQPVMIAGGDPAAQFNGLWADAAPLVAYSGLSGNSFLAVANAMTGDTLVLDSGRLAPIMPLLWRPGTLQLIYRDATSFIRIADLSCMMGQCPGNPFDSGLELIPASATDVQADNAALYYVDGGAVYALPLSCVDAGNCAGMALTLGTNVAPQSMMDVAGRTLVYTAYTQDPYNAADREVRVVDLACLGNPPACGARTVLTGATAGLLSPDGGYVVVERGGALHTLRLSDGQLAHQAEGGGPTMLSRARWSGLN